MEFGLYQCNAILPCISVPQYPSAEITLPKYLNWSTIRHFALKLPLNMGIWTPTDTILFGLTRVHNPNGMSIGSAFFAGLTIVTVDKQTDQQTDHDTVLG